MGDKKITDITVTELVTIAQVIHEYETLLKKSNAQLDNAEILLTDALKKYETGIKELSLYLHNVNSYTKQLINEINNINQMISRYKNYDSEIANLTETLMQTTKKTLQETNNSINAEFNNVKADIQNNINNVSKFISQTKDKVMSFIKVNTAIVIFIVTLFFMLILANSCMLYKVNDELNKLNTITTQRR